MQRKASAYHPYTNNPLIHQDRRLGTSSSQWARSFACDDMGVLIVCRGPIRKEAIDIFREMGVEKIGILISERDSIVYPRALSPELRIMEPQHVHPLPDYTGATKDERVQRIEQIIQICREHSYQYVFAGYGFMAEDAEFVRTLEGAGLTFIGPGSYTQQAAGAKDQAKRTAIENNVWVTPGFNDSTTRTLLAKYPTRVALAKLVEKERLDLAQVHDESLDLEQLCTAVLGAACARGIDLFTIDELAEQIRRDAEELLKANPGRRFRLKAIGGGGGKGQRIFGDASLVPTLVREVLSEVKATGAGDNKNMLLELNVEHTRHNEIQILGNGDWCIALGGRDCSLQMHEQKLVEVSITQEGFRIAIDQARAAGNHAKATTLESDLAVLTRMEAEAERFGRAVRLDSASTFECIVEGTRHYFMEVNTRIQVEHRVSELCYALRFTNPADSSDYFDVHSLVECMALIARHKATLPKPTRVQRATAALEVRLNATDRALNPAAGGVIISWSDPIDGEIRDDQGISIKNPDTGLFMRYRLAGAYDSNIALLLATGDNRASSFERLAEILRRTNLRGLDLATNLEFLFGIVAWFKTRDEWAKPTTNFVVPYLTLVGELAREAQSIDFDYAFRQIGNHALHGPADHRDPAQIATRHAFELKETLLERPIALLIDEPHFLSAWLSHHRHDFALDGQRVQWNRNPLDVLSETYHLLHLDDNPGEPAAQRIWDHDNQLLATGLRFYAALRSRISEALTWPQLDHVLRHEQPAFGFNPALWQEIHAAHLGHQLGFDILSILPMLAERVGFFDLALEDDLNISIPDRLLEPTHQLAMRKVLVPPPVTKSDEIVAAMGGTFYPQEAPHLPAFVTKGCHFDRGDPLYIIEVMKMFNKVYAEFAGTIDEIFVPDSGVVVRKGQPLFKVTPDEHIVEEDRSLRLRRIRSNTDSYLARLFSDS